MQMQRFHETVTVALRSRLLLVSPYHKVAAGLTALILLAGGLLGVLGPAWGYGLFFTAVACLAGCVFWAAILTMTRRGQANVLVRQIRIWGRTGIAIYILAAFALAGYYSHETLAGRMEWQWIIFGPMVLGTLAAFEWGLYRKLLKANALSWRRYQRFIDRDLADPKAMRKVMRDDVIMHRALWRISPLRWWRHTLIFWGFSGMFFIEVFAVFLREAVPAFGWPDIWRTPGHPVRELFESLYDLTGLMMLFGCALATYWGWTVRNSVDRKYADRPMVLFLGFVVLSGFVLEGWRIALQPDAVGSGYAFVGMVFAWILAPVAKSWPEAYQSVWLIHGVASCALIAYIPYSRLIHTCATPIGRLMNSQKSLLQAKKLGVLAGLWRQGLLNSAANKPKDVAHS